MRSQKLTRTLQELETAFTDWDSLAETEPRKGARSTAGRGEKSPDAQQAEDRAKEFRKKTKKLLNQLRQQLAELGD